MHAAAYRVLGLPWSYEAIEMTGDRLPGFLDGLDGSWRGLSLTMPVKRDVLPLLDERHELVQLTGVCNTMLLEDGRRRGFNTDVHGIVAAFVESGWQRFDHVLVLGGGATASSAIVAAARLGAGRVTLSVRSPERSLQLLGLGEELGISVTLERLGDTPAEVPDAVISTLPNGVDTHLVLPDEVLSGCVLFDVAYDPWPSTLATRWQQADGTVISGLGMLLHQAVMQVRVFVNGAPEAALPEEESVLVAMREALQR